MNIHRRELLAALGGMAAVRALPSPAQQASDRSFPRKSDFALPEGLTYLNGAYTHPLPSGAVEAMRRHVEARSRPGVESTRDTVSPEQVKQEFAALINAQPSEIGFVPNTSTGENLVVNGLEIPGTQGNVVTAA